MKFTIKKSKELDLRMEETKKFYSQKAIAIATFFGGPLAAGYLIKKNYQTLKEESNAKKAMLIGIAATLVLFGIVFSVPEAIIDKIPNMILPAIYTGVIYLIVEKTQGESLKLHEEEGGEFHSGWTAAGVGGISLVVLIVGMLLLFVAQEEITKSNYDYETYESEFVKFSDNESEALQIFNSFETTAPDKLQEEILMGIELWKENKAIIENLNSIENLPQDLISQNQRFSTYCDLRLKHYELFLKSVIEDTESYLPEIDQITSEINELLEDNN